MTNILGTFKLILPAGELTPTIIGPLLGQYGLNLAKFCKEFNAKTTLSIGIKVRVKVIIFDNKTYKIKIYSLPISTLILKFLNLSKGSSKPNKIMIGKLTKSIIFKLLHIKYTDLYPISKKSLIKMIKGTANSMGIFN
nr:ribosomal protein L11 [Coccidia sp. AB-2023a]